MPLPLLLYSNSGKVQAPPDEYKRLRRIKSCTFIQKPNHQISLKMAEDLKKVADLITANTIFCTKEVLTSDECAKYMGISKSYLYKLTMRGEIPHFKPLGKMCYFNRVEIEQWLQNNRVATSDEISQKASAYCMSQKGGVL